MSTHFQHTTLLFKILIVVELRLLLFGGHTFLLVEIGLVGVLVLDAIVRQMAFVVDGLLQFVEGPAHLFQAVGGSQSGNDVILELLDLFGTADACGKIENRMNILFVICCYR